jgi:hypothetical protein
MREDRFRMPGVSGDANHRDALVATPVDPCCWQLIEGESPFNTLKMLPVLLVQNTNSMSLN